MKQPNTNNLSPVLITIYDRLDCLQNAITHLKDNNLAKHTNVYIVSDNAYKIEHQDIINEIRQYIKNLDNKKYFNKVEGIFWDKNKGSYDSINDAITYLFTKYDRLIIFEDDILVSNKFLEYMNNALEFYKDDKRIMSIASHTHYKNIAYKGYPHEVYIVQMYSPWGVGIWKDRYEDIKFDLNEINEFLNNKKEVEKFNSISRHMLAILKDMIEKNKKYGDVIVCYNMFKQNRYTIYPIKPLSVNKGHDGRGEHCGTDKNWQNQELVNDFSPKLIKNIQLDPKIAKNTYRAFYSYKRDIIEHNLHKLGLYKPVRFIYKKIKALFVN